MSNLCGVRLSPGGKLYTFAYTNQKFGDGDLVVVETTHGLKIGEVVVSYIEKTGEESEKATKSVVRLATDKDFAMDAENAILAKKAFELCREKIIEMNLDMKLFKAEYTLDRSKVMLSYMSDQRIDFRELVKELVPALKTRIEMIQVGPREHAKFVGGLGMCGRQFCCQKFMTTFDPVTIKMAKDQGLTSNPTKYSGNCGKLLCCIRHEECAYEYAQGILPKSGAIVMTPDGIGKVVVSNILKETCSVKVGLESDFEIKSFNAGEITAPTEEERNAYLAAKKQERDEMEREREAFIAERIKLDNGDKEKSEEDGHQKSHREQGDKHKQRHPKENRQPRDQREQREPKEQKENLNQKENRELSDENRPQKKKNKKHFKFNKNKKQGGNQEAPQNEN